VTQVLAEGESDSRGLRFLRRLIDVSAAELPALGWCWLYIFSVLASYYILRPIRDQMGVAGGVDNLPWLFTGTLVVMLILNVPFSALVKLLPRKQFISISYRFFSFSILAFGAALYVASAEQAVWIGRFFFIWISVFNLFVVSIFWSMVVDIFSSEQGKRLFGFIAAGATLGAIVGSSVTASLAQIVQPAILMIGAALLLEVATWCVSRLSRLSASMSDRPHPEREEEPIGGGVMSGFIDAIRSPYLLNTAIFLLLYAVTSTFLYFNQASVVSTSFTNRGAQTAFFATIDLIVNVITLVIQVFLTGRLVGWFGVTAILSLLPAVSILGFGFVYAMPVLAAVAAFQVARRAGNFALTQPARQILYTVVSREDRYKAKNFIDTAIYRVGDQVGAWSYAIIGMVGWGIKESGVVAVAISAAWLLNSVWLGRRQEVMAAAQARESGLRSVDRPQP
jgi:ATP:ADP antiporter, AAA family